MQLSGQDIITKAMKDLGVLQPGETPNAADAADVLLTANLMLDSWKTNSLLIFVVKGSDFPVVVGQQAYTVGPGGNFNVTPRPSFIPRISVLWNGNPSMPIEYNVEILDYSRWQTEIPVKNVGSTIPLKVWDDHGYPFRTLNFWPYPTDAANLTIRLYLPSMLDSLALNTTYDFAPGFMEAVISNLAIRICPIFRRAASDELKGIATVTLAQVKRINSQVRQSLLRSDRAILGQPGRWDWRSDTMR